MPIGAALLFALIGLVAAIRDRPMGLVPLTGLALLEVALLVQTVIAITRLPGTEMATFIGRVAALSPGSV
ncbi:hypothetical protein [Microbispora sp. NBC_01389]|uniref:hypothetical protein n=1 Tax=Microbispora sp. NBC_01389 TaxID=2903584 RepID=UPI003247362B